jgi:hypothetical protein
MVGMCAAAIALTIGLWSARGRELPAVRISLTSDPSGALVYRVGSAVPLGATPLVITAPLSEAPLDLACRFADGTIEHLRTVPDRSRHLHARLLAEPVTAIGDPPGDG